MFTISKQLLNGGVKDEKRFLRRLRTGAGLPGGQVLFYDADADVVAFMSADILMQKIQRRMPYHIFGIAKNSGEAKELMRALTEEALAQTGTPDVVAYLKAREGLA